MTRAPELHYVSDRDFLTYLHAIAAAIAADAWTPEVIVGIGRGGLVPAVYLSHLLGRPMLSLDYSAKLPAVADEQLGTVAASSAAGTRSLFVDDINDTGATIASIRDLLAVRGCEAANLRIAAIVDNSQSRIRVDYRAQTIDRRTDKRWFVFPWEAVAARSAIVGEALSVPERLA